MVSFSLPKTIFQCAMKLNNIYVLTFFVHVHLHICIEHSLYVKFMDNVTDKDTVVKETDASLRCET